MQDRETDLHNPSEEEPASEKANRRLRLILRGAMVGISSYLISGGQKPEVFSVMGYIIGKKLVREIVAEKSFWQQVVVESGMASLFVLYFQDEIPVAWQFVMEMMQNVFRVMEHEKAIEFLEQMKDIPNSAVLLIAFATISLPFWTNQIRKQVKLLK